MKTHLVQALSASRPPDGQGGGIVPGSLLTARGLRRCRRLPPAAAVVCGGRIHPGARLPKPRTAQHRHHARPHACDCSGRHGERRLPESGAPHEGLQAHGSIPAPWTLLRRSSIAHSTKGRLFPHLGTRSPLQSSTEHAYARLSYSYLRLGRFRTRPRGHDATGV